MAHTLLEQELDMSTSTTPVEDIRDLFVQQFGYTNNGDYYFSPVDTKFGVRWYIDGNYLHCAVTFDGGVTETDFIKQTVEYTNLTFTKIYYHVSKNEKVIYLRIICQNASSGSHSVDVVIAHDEKNKTVCFRGLFSGSTSSSNNNMYMLDNQKTIFAKDNVGAVGYNVNAEIPNAIYRYPSTNNYCLCSELYGIVNVQTFDTLSGTYINFSGQIYRIISCFDTCTTASSVVYVPYFAFPVSD